MHNKIHTLSQGAEPRAAALGDAAGALDIGVDGRGAQKDAGRRAERIGQQCAPRVGQVPLLVQEPAAVADAHQSPDRIEEVDEEEGEHDDPEIGLAQHGEVELSGQQSASRRQEVRS